MDGCYWSSHAPGWEENAEGDSTIVRLWDVEAKRCIRSFVGHSRYAAVSFSAGCAESISWEESNLRIWDLSNGTWRQSIEIDIGTGKHAASNEEVFVPNEDGFIDVINIHTGVIRSSPRQAWLSDDMVLELHLCGNFLLAAVPHDADDYDDEARKAGIYILDRSSLELMGHVAGSYLCIKSAANGDVVAEKADGRFQVFQLVDDSLVFRTSFQRCVTRTDQIDESILLVHNSKA
jgi:hypothetical protein